MNAIKILVAGTFFVQIAAQDSCTDSVPNYNMDVENGAKGECLDFSTGNSYRYPADFGSVLNQFAIYQCSTSDKRVIISNGIPDHDISIGNPNGPCELKWAVSMPLNPTKLDSESRSEIPIRGIIAMAVNGVPAYGPQEGGSTNAVEPAQNAQITDAQYWYGHAARSNDWHFHNPHLGKENPTSDTLLAYALDGFPIYGPLTDDSGLDECNGRTVNGVYQYHVRSLDQVDGDSDYCKVSGSPENNWNYVLGCYSGSLESTEVAHADAFTLPGDCVLVSGEEGASDSPSPTRSRSPSSGAASQSASRSPSAPLESPFDNSGMKESWSVATIALLSVLCAYF